MLPITVCNSYHMKTVYYAKHSFYITHIAIWLNSLYLNLQLHLKQCGKWNFIKLTGIVVVLCGCSFRHDFHFPGHLLPGTAFITMGVWWIWNAFKVYSENEQRTNSDCTHDCSPFPATYNGDTMGFLYCEGFYKVRDSLSFHTEFKEF